VWRTRGEAAWRAEECSALERALVREGQIVALGGGTPVIEAARQRIQRLREAGRAWTVYLRCPARELARRLAAAPGDRPSLTGRHPVEEVAAVVAAREPAYRLLADAICDVQGRGAEDVAHEIALLAAGVSWGRGGSAEGGTQATKGE
jgi:shikimate kinase